MIVVPQRAQRLIDIAIGADVVRVESGQNIRILLIVEVADLEEIARETIAFRRSVPIVEMGTDRRHPKSAVLGRRWEPVVVPHQNWLVVVVDVSWAGAGRVNAVVEGPHCLHSQVGRLADVYGMLRHVVKRSPLNESTEQLMVPGAG